MSSSPTLDAAALEALVGRRITVSGHFVGPVTLDRVEDLGDTIWITVRLPDGSLGETGIGADELADGTLNQSLIKLRDLVAGGTLRLNITVEARTGDGGAIDRVRAHKAVIEPLEEDPDVDVRPEWLGGS